MTEFIEECIEYIFNVCGACNLSYTKNYSITLGIFSYRMRIYKNNYSIEIIVGIEIIFSNGTDSNRILFFEKEYKEVCKQLIIMIEDAIHSSIEEFIERN